MTRASQLALWTALAVLAACDTTPTAEALAARRFDEFQRALLRRDQPALRQLLCADARPAIHALCGQDRSDQQALQITGVSQRNYEYLVHVTDPNRDGAASHFVLTVEDGAMRIDLRATYRDHSVEQRRFLAKERFVPQRLTPEQIERARVIHSAPPGR